MRKAKGTRFAILPGVEDQVMPLHDWKDEWGWDGVHLLWLAQLLDWIQPRLPPGYRAYVGSVPDSERIGDIHGCFLKTTVYVPDVKEGWPLDEVRKVLEKLGIKDVNESTLRTGWTDGRNPTYSRPADLTEEEMKQLRELRRHLPTA